MPLVLALSIIVAQANGEDMLRQMLDRCGRLRNTEILISKSGRNRKDEPLGPELDGILCYQSPNRFRYTHADYWGGGTAYISDGKTLRVVSGDFGPTFLRKAGNSVTDSHPALSRRGGAFAAIFLFLEGERAYDKLVAPGAKVQVRGSTLSFKTKDFGDMSITLWDGLARSVEYDNKANRMAAYRFVPVFGDPPEDPLEVEVLSYRSVSKFPRGTFETSVAKGEEVVDERKGERG